MNVEDFIPLQEICTHYEVEVAFMNELGEIGLIQLNIIEEKQYVHQGQIRNIEKMIRMHHELDVNIEGIDIVFNLLDKIDELQVELKDANRKLKRFEE